MVQADRIFTHAGFSHADDLLSVALLLTKFPAATIHRVARVDERDLDNPEVIVVDVGSKFEPEKNNFDHHQDRNLPASLILVIRHYFPEIPEDIEELQWISDWDTMGPVAQKKWGVNLPSFRDSIAEVVLRAFSKAKVIKPGDLLHDMLIMLGSELLEFLKEQKEFIEKAKNAEVFEVKGLKVVKLSENVPVRFVKKVHSDVAIVVQPNQRESGKLSVTRIDDHPRVDFNRVRELEEVTFVHPTGFMAVVEPGALDEVLEKATSSS